MMRQEEEVDPEAEADFDQAFEKMMAESIDSRKFERRALFDVPLPMRRGTREDLTESGPQTPSNTMSFALMTKKGNRYQVRLWVKPFREARIFLPAQIVDAVVDADD